MAGSWTGNKPLPEQMRNQFAEEYYVSPGYEQ